MMINLIQTKNKILKYFFLINILLFFPNITIGIENKIIFKINDKAYTSHDYELRVKYLDFVGNNNNLDNNVVLDDFVSANLFFEYYRELNNEVDNEKINEIFKNIKDINKKNKKEYNFEINKENILYNLKIDYIRKTILENILNSKINNLKISEKEIDLLYKFNLKYLNFNINNNKVLENEINILKDINLKNILNLLSKYNTSYFIKEREINNIEIISKDIRKNILSNNNFIIKKDKTKFSFIFIEKSFETLNGLIVTLYSVGSVNEIEQKDLLCKKLINEDSNPNIINKEYKFIDLNNKLKNNLININDFIKIENNNNNIYIVLCDIKYDKEILNNINFNKLVNSNVSEIEKKFVKKYSKKYNFIMIND